MNVRFLALASLCSATIALSACAQNAAGPAGVTPATAVSLAASPRGAASGPIGHIVVIMQENRSFDNLFHGFPGADTASEGKGHTGRTYRLAPLSLTYPHDIAHAHFQFLEDYANGKNDGFDEQVQNFKSYCKGASCAAGTCPYPDAINHPSCWNFLGDAPQSAPYSFVPRNETVPYWTLAQTYALGDRTFESNNGPSFPSHLYMISGQSLRNAENPELGTTYNMWGCDSSIGTNTVLLEPGTSRPPAFPRSFGHEIYSGFPCYTSYPTIVPLLDAANVTWSYYAPTIGGNPGSVWSVLDAIWPVRFGVDWLQDVKTPETRVLLDVANGTLPQVSWVVPSFVNSDHSSSDSATGPQWVATIVNAIGNSPYWNDTVIVIMWDDWGGWYDHVLPPQYPDATGTNEGLGYRVPVIIVSPYAKRGYVSHQQHEVASTLHLIETTFGLPSLGAADARADAFDDMLDFAQSPAPFTPVPTSLTRDYFLRQPASNKPPDD